MLSPLLSAPPFISPEEHANLTSSTPSSFNDIPPVLHWHDPDVSISLSPLSPDWSTWTSSQTKGSLWVTEAAVSFIPSDVRPGFTLPFPALTLHALTSSSEGVSAHLYCQVDESDAPPLPPAIPSTAQAVNGNGNENGPQVDGDEDDNGGEGGEDEFTPMREVRIYLPEAKLQPLFAALSRCSALHASLLPNGETSNFFGFGDSPDGPDDDEAFDDADEGPNGDADGGAGGGEGGRADENHLHRDRIQERGEQDEGEEDDDDEDPVEAFLGKVDWGNVPKPEGWDEDAEE